MKIGFGKRILMFLHWFISLAICIMFALSLYFPQVFNAIRDCYVSLLGVYGAIGLKISAIAVGVVYALLSILQAGIIFKRRAPRSERGFITVDSSDNSRVRIAISAIEQMVRQSVHAIDGIADMKIAIDSADDAIGIKINASIIAGSHVPTITLNMQQAIRRFVEMNCGVAVRKVEVCINSVLATDAAGRKKHRNVKMSNPADLEIPISSGTDIKVEEPVSEIIAEENIVIEANAANDDCIENGIVPAEEEPSADTSLSDTEDVDCITEETNIDKQVLSDLE